MSYAFPKTVGSYAVLVFSFRASIYSVLLPEPDGARQRSPSGPPVTRMGKMVMYSVKGLEQYMEERTVERR